MFLHHFPRPRGKVDETLHGAAAPGDSTPAPHNSLRCGHMQLSARDAKDRSYPILLLSPVASTGQGSTQAHHSDTLILILQDIHAHQAPC